MQSEGDRPVWQWNGSLEKPTVSPSLLIFAFKVDDNSEPTGERETVCHSFIRDGRIEFLSDSQHGLAGQTVDLPEF